MAGKNGSRNPFEMRSQIDINTLDIGALSSYSNHISQSNPGAHQIGNIDGLQLVLTGLQTELDGKVTAGTGFTGDVVVVTGVSVDFAGETVTETTQTMTYADGILTGVV